MERAALGTEAETGTGEARARDGVRVGLPLVF